MVTTPVHSIANCRPTGRVAGASNEVQRSSLSGATVRFDPGPPTRSASPPQLRYGILVSRYVRRRAGPVPLSHPFLSGLERRVTPRTGGFE